MMPKCLSSTVVRRYKWAQYRHYEFMHFFLSENLTNSFASCYWNESGTERFCFKR